MMRMVAQMITSVPRTMPIIAPTGKELFCSLELELEELSSLLASSSDVPPGGNAASLCEEERRPDGSTGVDVEDEVEDAGDGVDDRDAGGSGLATGELEVGGS